MSSIMPPAWQARSSFLIRASWQEVRGTLRCGPFIVYQARWALVVPRTPGVPAWPFALPGPLSSSLPGWLLPSLGVAALTQSRSPPLLPSLSLWLIGFSTLIRAGKYFIYLFPCFVICLPSSDVRFMRTGDSVCLTHATVPGM